MMSNMALELTAKVPCSIGAFTLAEKGKAVQFGAAAQLIVMQS